MKHLEYREVLNLTDKKDKLLTFTEILMIPMIKTSWEVQDGEDTKDYEKYCVVT